MSYILLKNIKAVYCSEKLQKKNVDILIENNRIKNISPSIKVEADRIIDCTNCVVLPGFVNTHHHFFQTLTRALPKVQNSKLFDWLVYLYEIWKNLDDEMIYYSTLTAIAEMLKSGCTLTTDHHYLYAKNMNDPMGTQFKAAQTLGIRFSPTRGSMCLSKKDGGLPPDTCVQSIDEILENSEDCIKKYHDNSEDSMSKIVLAPCSPFSVTKDCMLKSARLARKYGVKLHTHLCETMDEEENCKNMYNLRPVELMEECEFIGDDVFYAHGIWFNDKELDVLKKNGAGIAHCPNSNMRLGSGICRVKEMNEKGINVALAVDGSASGDSSNMLLEARAALYLQRIKYGSDAISAYEVFKMATINGAKMLGYNNLGTIEENKLADIAIFDVSSLEYAGGQSDPIASLLFCTPKNSRYTIVNGKIVVDDYNLVGFDEQTLIKEQNRCADKLYKLSGIV